MIRIALTLLALVAAGSGARADLNTDLAAYWSFDGHLSDPIGEWHARSATEQPAFEPGKFGSALSVVKDAPAARLLDKLGSALDVEEGVNFSFSAWVRTRTLHNREFRTIISKGGTRGWRLMYSSFEQSLSCTTPDYISGGSWPLEVDEWQHIAMVLDLDVGLSVFINGMLKEAKGQKWGSSFSPNTQLGFGNRSGTGFSWDGLIDDFAIWKRALTSQEISQIYRGGLGTALSELLDDEDRDSLPTIWEDRHDLSSTVADASSDPDDDGLTNTEELKRGTKPSEADSDQDGLPDNVETATQQWQNADDTGTHPLLADSDNDGLSDSLELDESTDPNKFDTDGDGFSDGDEVAAGLDPLVPNGLEHLDLNLAAYWDFNDDLEDHQGEFHGTAVGNVQFVQGKFDRGLMLDRDSYVELLAEGNDAFEFAGHSFSLAAWVGIDTNKPKPGGDTITYGGNQYWKLRLQDISFGLGGTSSNLLILFDPGVRDIPGAVSFHPFPGGGSSSGNPLPGGISGISLSTVSANFSRDRMYHLVVIYDRISNTTATYHDGVWIPNPSGILAGSPRPDHTGLRIGGFNGSIDDVAIWKRSLTEQEILALFADGRGRPVAEVESATDQDGDGLPDIWETEQGLDPTFNDSTLDADGDGLTHAQEFEKRTDPLNPDSDSDGYLDGVESFTGTWVDSTNTGTDPLDPDSDDDGLLDGTETPGKGFLGASQAGSDPNRIDSDGDFFPDGDEVRLGSDPTSIGSGLNLDEGLAAYWPLDNDASDWVGQLDGTVHGNATFNEAAFEQGVLLNGLDQYIEIPGAKDGINFSDKSFTVSAWFRSDPPHADDPSIAEGVEAHPAVVSQGFDEGWAIDKYQDAIGLSLEHLTRRKVVRRSGSTDGRLHHVVAISNILTKVTSLYVDGQFIEPKASSTTTTIMSPTIHPIWIGGNPGLQLEAYATVNGFWSGLVDDVAVWERALTADEAVRLFEAELSLKALIEPVDADGDGLDDEWENTYGFGVGTDDSQLDPDGDGLTNLAERNHGLDPTNPDTDADGLIDGVETDTGVWRNEQDTGTSPKVRDSDEDGLADNVENPNYSFAADNQPGTDPNTNDSDGDGTADLIEAMASTDPTDSTSVSGGTWKLRVVNSNERFLRSTTALEALKVQLGDTVQTFEATTINWAPQTIDDRIRISGSIGGDSPFPHLVDSPDTSSSTVVEVTGSIFAGAAGIRTLSMAATQGLLFIDDQLVHEYNGAWGEPHLIPVHLNAGFHEIKVITWMSGTNGMLELGISALDPIERFEEGNFMLLQAADPNGVGIDRDSDGLLDGQEATVFPNDLTQLTFQGDWDNDGISDSDELARGTNPASDADTLESLFTLDDPLANNDAYLRPSGKFETRAGGTISTHSEPLVDGFSVRLQSADERQRAWLEIPPTSQSRFTLSLWFKSDTPFDGATVLASRGDSAEEAPFALGVIDGQLFWQVTDEDDKQHLVTSPEPLKEDQLYHVAVVHRASPLSAALYVDGQQVVLSDWPLNSTWKDSLAPLMIGGTPSGFGFNGRLDQLSIYRRSLNDQEVMELFINPTQPVRDPPIDSDFRIISLEASATERTLSWQSLRFRRYQIEYSKSLKQSSFEPIAEVVSDGTTTTFTDVDPKRSGSEGFYRIALLHE